MNAREAEGIHSLMLMLLACTMKKHGIEEIHVTREELQRIDVAAEYEFTQGVFDGIRMKLKTPKGIEPTETVPVSGPTTLKPQVCCDQQDLRSGYQVGTALKAMCIKCGAHVHIRSLRCTCLRDPDYCEVHAA